ncbi:MAG: hypothetical protein CMO81_00625 [Waddliaceae bacterium]|nr:hypothetical protein [Waddliaceae bacterium]
MIFKLCVTIATLFSIHCYANNALLNIEGFKVEVIKLSHSDSETENTTGENALEEMIRRDLMNANIATTEHRDATVLHCQVISLPLTYQEGAAPVGFAYSIELKVEEFDELKRNEGIMTLISPWGTHMLQITTPELYAEHLRSSIREMVKRFIKDYKDAND